MYQIPETLEETGFGKKFAKKKINEKKKKEIKIINATIVISI